MMTDEGVIRTIKAISGDRCFDTVRPDFDSYARESADWALEGLLQTLIDLSPDEFHKNVKRPEILVVRTPRAQPYSFQHEGKYYTVLDEHLSRLIHRWSRFADLIEAEQIDPIHELEDINAERAYLCGDFVGCAKYYGSLLLAGPMPDAFAFSSADEELPFRKRSLNQHIFVAAHEIAHVLILQMDDHHRDYLRRRLLSLHVAGLEEDSSFPEGTDESALPSRVAKRIGEDSQLLDECLCDALAVAALIWHGVDWASAITAAVESLNLLWCLAYIDHRCLWVVHKMMDEPLVPESVEKAVHMYSSRTAAMYWFSNLTQRHLLPLGLGTLAAMGFLKVDRAGSTSRAALIKVQEHWPGSLFVEYMNSPPSPRDEYLESRVAYIMRSRSGAYRLLGFANPTPEPFVRNENPEPAALAYSKFTADWLSRRRDDQSVSRHARRLMDRAEAKKLRREYRI